MFSKKFVEMRRVTALFAVFATTLFSDRAVAHEYPSEIQVIVGQTNTFSVADAATCPAYVSATVTGAPLVTVTPSDGFGVKVDFTVVAGTNSGNTTITVQWIGSDAFAGTAGPCTEDTRPAGRQILVRVIPEPGTNNTANNPSSGRSGDPVNLANGELYFHEAPDLDLGGPLPLKFQRYYASRLRRNFIVGSLGNNWRHNFEWKLHWNGNLIVLVTGEGKVLKYLKESNVWTLKTPTDNPLQVIQNGTQILVGDARNQRIYRFDGTGNLLELSDGKGNSLLFTYSNGNLFRVQDNGTLSVARSLEFSYTSGKLTSVRETTGNSFLRVVSFSYTGDNLTTYTDAAGKFTQYAYDLAHADPGLLVSVTHPDANIPWQQTWDIVGKVATQTDAYGNTMRFNYGPPQTPGTTIVTNADNTVWTYTHNAAGSLKSVTDPKGQTISFGATTNLLLNGITNRLGGNLARTFDPTTGATTAETDENGNPVFYTYATRTGTNGISFRDLVLVSFPDGTVEQFKYDSSGNLLVHTNRAGDVWSYSYNTNGQVLLMTNALGGVTTNVYNTFRDLSTTRDPAGNLATYTYDANKRVTRITWADNNFRTFQYDALNRLLARRDERGFSIRSEYSFNGNLITLTNRQGAITRFQHDRMNRITNVIHALGNPTILSYDVMGRLAAMTGPNTNTFGYLYDHQGRVVSISDSLGLVETNVYNPNGVLVSKGDALASRSFGVDAGGRMQQINLPGGAAMALSYDKMDRIVGLDQDGLETSTTYDPRGNVSSMTMPGGSVTAGYTFNALGKITKVVDANGRQWNRQYDSAGRITSATDPVGNAVGYGYNNRNRIAQMTYPAGLGSCTYTYDAVGSLTRALYTDGTDLNYTYDNGGQMLTGPNLSLMYDAKNSITNCNGLITEFDAGRRVKRLTFASGKFVDYEHDRRDRLVRMIDWLGGITTFSYNAVNQVTNIVRPNGVQTVYTYDVDRNLVGILEKTAGSQLAFTSFTREQRGNVISENRTHPALMPALTLNPATRNYVYTNNSQNAALTHDAIGRLSNDGTRNYQWNLASRLVSYTQSPNTVSFAYDGNGHRISRIAGAVNHQYVWNYGSERPSLAIIRNGTTIADLQYNVFTPDGELVYSIFADNSRRFYHFDEMGNTHFVTDGSGTPIVAYRYSPYGEVITDSSNGSVSNPFTWQGRYSVMREGSSSLYYVRARYYDASVGGFISRDPVTTHYPQFFNPYLYAGGNPLLYRDPSGQEITKMDVASGAANTYATGLGSALGNASEKLARIAKAAGDGPGGQAIAARAQNLKNLGSNLDNVGNAAAVASAALEAYELNDRLNDIQDRRAGEESRLVGTAQRLAADAKASFDAKRITLEQYFELLRAIDEALLQQLTANADIGFVDTALESTKSMLKSVAGIAPLPGGAWDSYFDWLEGK